MGVGAFLEPAVVLALLFGGTYFNRNTSYSIWARRDARSPVSSASGSRTSSPDGQASGMSGSQTLLRRSHSPLLPDQEPRWRKRELRLLGWRREVVSPNTKVFKQRFLSRLLRKFPFLVEAWYWALIYWVNTRPCISMAIKDME